MKSFILSYATAALAIAMATPVFAAASPWDGSWKLDQDKSKLTGATFSYTMTPDGKFQFSDGANTSYTFACDGKPYPTIGSYAIACTSAGPSDYHFTYSANGKATDSDVYKLSADGASILDVDTMTRPDGTTETSSDTYSRVAGTSGLAGTWKDVKSSSDAAFSFDMTSGPSGMTLSLPAWKETIALHLDGNPSPVSGPTVSPGSTWIAKSSGPNEFSATSELGGKAMSAFDFALNPDGKTMTVSIWTVGKESEKRTEIFRKQ